MERVGKHMPTDNTRECQPAQKETCTPSGDSGEVGALLRDTIGRLTERSYWEAIHADQGTSMRSASACRSRWGKWLHNLATQESISDRIFWGALMPRFVLKPAGATIVEIGSAPGRILLEFHRRLGYSPYGIEYTSAGAEANRDAFRRNGLDPDRVIQADLFDQDRLRSWRGRFDIVLSAGLIEHFKEPTIAIQRHVDLLAPSGLLVVTIPNLQGFNKALCQLSCPDRLAVHNLSIMNRAQWVSLFNELGLTPLYAGYYGVVDFGLIDGESRIGPYFLQAARIVNILLATGLRYLPESLRTESRIFSPYLIYIGKNEGAR
jgi:2-polyprenyl-3-methyl-5-hydroxy-6-metoxy-1,4-benzoquinol methylase